MKTNSSKPAISVLMPVYNAGAYLRDAIDSVLNQQFTNFEFLIINDGSTDGSRDLIDAYAQKDSRIRAIHQPNKGLVDTLNHGVSITRAPLIARMDADDICLPERFALQYQAISKDDNTGILGSYITLMDEKGNSIRTAYYPQGGKKMADFIERGSPFAHPAVMMRKSAVLAVGGYRKAFTHAEDYDLWLRIYEQGYKLVNLPIILLKYRQNSMGISVTHRDQQLLATLVARAAHCMRVRGLADPIKDGSMVSENTLNQMPAQCLTSLKSEWLTFQYRHLSLQTKSEITSAIKKLKAQKLIKGHRLANLYCLAAYGMLKQKALLPFTRHLISAFFCSPIYCAKLTLRQIWRSI